MKVLIFLIVSIFCNKSFSCSPQIRPYKNLLWKPKIKIVEESLPRGLYIKKEKSYFDVSSTQTLRSSLGKPIVFLRKKTDKESFSSNLKTWDKYSPEGYFPKLYISGEDRFIYNNGVWIYGERVELGFFENLFGFKKSPEAFPEKYEIRKRWINDNLDYNFFSYTMGMKTIKESYSEEKGWEQDVEPPSPKRFQFKILYGNELYNIDIDLIHISNSEFKTKNEQLEDIRLTHSRNLGCWYSAVSEFTWLFFSIIPLIFLHIYTHSKFPLKVRTKRFISEKGKFFIINLLLLLIPFFDFIMNSLVHQLKLNFFGLRSFGVTMLFSTLLFWLISSGGMLIGKRGGKRPVLSFILILLMSYILRVMIISKVSYYQIFYEV
tara:strand:- start:268 stop:1398 length:1131 start_codon:yes stop_codon:yes gene_type:complete